MEPVTWVVMIMFILCIPLFALFGNKNSSNCKNQKEIQIDSLTISLDSVKEKLHNEKRANGILLLKHVNDSYKIDSLNKKIFKLRIKIQREKIMNN